MDVEPLAFRPNQAALALDVSPDTIFRAIARGELASIKVGSARLIPKSELEAFIARRMAAAS